MNCEVHHILNLCTIKKQYQCAVKYHNLSHEVDGAKPEISCFSPNAAPMKIPIKATGAL